jgi:hypothetical protein
MRTAPLILAFLVSPLACGGATQGPSAQQGTPGDGATTDAPPPGVPVPSGPTPAACAGVEPTSPVSFGLTADLLAKVAGEWRNCMSAPLPLGTLGGPAGFEVSPDGQYNALGFDAEGNIVRLTGFFNEAQFLVDMSLAPTPRLIFADSSEWPMQLSLSQDGTSLVSSSEAGRSGPFLASHDAIIQAPTGPAGAREGARGCNTMESGVQQPPATTAEATQRLLGRWTMCPDSSGNLPLLGPGSTRGIEFASDETWAFLVPEGAGGALVPSTDPDGHGQFNTSTEVGQGVTGLYMHTGGIGTFVFVFATSSSPVKLQLISEGGPFILSAE